MISYKLCETQTSSQDALAVEFYSCVLNTMTFSSPFYNRKNILSNTDHLHVEIAISSESA